MGVLNYWVLDYCPLNYSVWKFVGVLNYFLDYLEICGCPELLLWVS